MKIGDVSRSRRFADPARQRWYAYHRAVRFAVRMGHLPAALPFWRESAWLVPVRLDGAGRGALNSLGLCQGPRPALS